jgi:hypothetical protein
MGAPIQGAKEVINRWTQEGKTIIIHSVWAGDTMKEWLRFYEFPELEVTNIKPRADYYLDDKAIRFTDWTTAQQFIEQDLNA